MTSDPVDTFSEERLASVFRELGDNKLSPVPFFTLMDHPIIQDCLALCHRYKMPVSQVIIVQTLALITYYRTCSW